LDQIRRVVHDQSALPGVDVLAGRDLESTIDFAESDLRGASFLREVEDLTAIELPLGDADDILRLDA
jgi:hypothetical protein